MLMPKVLILIDDDEDDIQIMKEAVGEIDKTTISLSFINPEEAIIAIRDLLISPDYIFIDINMAPFSGDKCLKELRKDSSLNYTKIAMLSTSIPSPVSQKLIESGANFTFEKPHTFEGYQRMLKQVFFGEL